MSVEPKQRLSVQDYLAIERHSETRNEYLDGEMFAMTGATRWHNLIVASLTRDLGVQLKGRPCELYPNEIRVHIPATGLYTYPDVAVVCGEPRFEDAELDTLLNPTLIIEVLSPTTEVYDRGKKFEHYQTIESLAEYVLVAQDKPRVEQFVRQDGNRWLLSTAAGLEGSLVLPSIQCTLALAEVYDRIAFG